MSMSTTFIVTYKSGNEIEYESHSALVEGVLKYAPSVEKIVQRSVATLETDITDQFWRDSK